MPRSNDMGRSYEFALCNQIKRNFINVTLTERAEAEQERDNHHFDDLDLYTQNEYIKSAELICSNWLTDKINCQEEYTLDRLPDRAGVSGDVTDIRIESNNEQINISLKHNHDALKHPRLTRLPSWVCKNDDDSYYSMHDLIWDRFFDAAYKLNPDATLFKDITSIDADFINNNLYNPFCSFITDYLSENTHTPKAVQNMFAFLVGTYNFYKIIDRTDHISIQDFINIPAPNSVEVFQINQSHIGMIFDNGVELDLRLHTASSRLIRSVKFDVRGTFDNIKSLIIKK